MESSIKLFDALADDYDVHFVVPHRRAYDELAWELVQPLLPDVGGLIIDAGCGSGRWAARLLDLGHVVLGIEQAPAMAAAARARLPTDRFQLLEGSMEEVDVPKQSADLALALGSLQYTVDPQRTIERFASWLRPGGWVVVLVDSLIALAVELLQADRERDVLQHLETHTGTWAQREHRATLHLFDRQELELVFRSAGLTEVRSHGLLVGMSALGRATFLDRLTADFQRQLDLERQLAQRPQLADLGKQLLVVGRRAAST